MWHSPVIKNILTTNLHQRQTIPATFIRKMRFLRFEIDGRKGLGVELKENGDVVDITSFDPTLTANMREFIEGSEQSLTKAKAAVSSGKVLQRDRLKILAPIDNPDKLICIGMNYHDHCAEQGLPTPEEPVVFSKFNSTIIGPTDGIRYPKVTKELDWEVELAIVIGKEGKDIPEEKAMEYVFGYTVAHDVSARDWQLQRNGKQFLIGKSLDDFCPLGPSIVTKDEIKDPHNLKLWTKVNGVTKQDSNTSQLVFKTQAIVEFLSRFFTLKPGDTILTGTPPGVGVFRKPPEFLKVGDVVEVGIESIGVLSNKIIKS